MKCNSVMILIRVSIPVSILCTCFWNSASLMWLICGKVVVYERVIASMDG